MGQYVDPQDYAPDWQPRWDDVAFDHEAAAALVTALRAADKASTDAAHTRATYAEHASVVTPHARGAMGPWGMTAGGIFASWRGAQRERWETDYRTSLTDATAFHQRITALITTINRASAAATAEQGRRVAGRARWQADYDEGRKKMQADLAVARKGR